MGADRFTCYKAAGEVVLQQNPWNSIQKAKQLIQIKANDIITKSVQRPPCMKEKEENC